MKQLSLLSALSILLFTLISCQEPTDMSNLQGYWEIEKAELPNGFSRDYTVNTSVDHYQLTSDSTGFKTRVQPQLDGTFLASDHRENFKISVEKGKPVLIFSTNLSEHKAEVVRLKENQLILVNEDQMKYTYRRFTNFELK